MFCHRNGEYGSFLGHGSIKNHTTQLRWRTGNALTVYSALYPAAFGETIAFAYELERSYYALGESWQWKWVSIEIETFADGLFEKMPSQEEVLAMAKD